MSVSRTSQSAVLGRRARLFVGIASATLILSGAAYAQEVETEEAAAEQDIVVTGTRAPRPDYAFSNPVVSLDAEALQYSGDVNLTDALQDLPALVNSLDSNDTAGSNAFIGGAGLNLLNLRNLGTDRTLVLVNSRRHVASLAGSASVDINTIPIDLVERVEVLTGGASAIYGADGVSGVVNFVMKDDFVGGRFRIQAGTPEESGADTLLVSGALGTNFAGGRGNVSAAVEFTREDNLSALERDFAGGGQRQLFVRNPADLADDPNVPDNIPLRDVRFFDSSRAGAVDTDFDFVQDFNGTGQSWNAGAIPFIPPFYQQGGDGTPLDEYIGDLLPEQERIAFNLFAHYDLTSDHRLFGEFKYVSSETLTFNQPSFDFFLAVQPDNPYLPANIASALAASGAPFALVSRDHFDLGVRGDDIQRQTRRAVVGLEGEILGGIDYEVSYVRGVTDADIVQINNRYNDRFAAALDVVINPATGQPVCASNLDPSLEPFNVSWQGFAPPTSFTPGPNSGCAPINIFGDGAVSTAARDWIMFDSVATSKVSQDVAQAYLSGDLDRLFTLPGGSIGWAVGAEWRREESVSVPAPEDTAGITFGNVLQPESGSFEVREGFAELSLPLLEGLPFAHELAVDVAGRYSEYSTIGDARTWKAGLVWAPIRDITFRGTVAEAVRAPNIGELFSPEGQSFQFITDPCDIGEVNNGTQFRQANCASILSALGVNPATFIDPNSASVEGTLRGNRNLTEETAETVTIGAIFRPRFIDNLTISVDWYDINLDNAINTATPQEIVDQCVDLPTTANQFCGLINRDPANGGIDLFRQQPVNVANFTTQGYDFSVTYQFDPRDFGVTQDLGVFDFRLIGSKLEDLTFINLPGAEPDRDLGEGGSDQLAPEWQVNVDLRWERGPFTVAYGWNYFGETQRYTLLQRQGDPDIAAPQHLDYKARSTHDLQARVRFGEGENLAFYAGVNNLTNEEPDIGEVFYPVSAVGRFFYFGFTASLPSGR